MQAGGIGQQRRLCHRVLVSFHFFFGYEESISTPTCDGKRSRQISHLRGIEPTFFIKSSGEPACYGEVSFFTVSKTIATMNTISITHQ